jgi:hypothetical protein
MSSIKEVEEGSVISESRFLQSKNMSFRNMKRHRGIKPTDIDLSYEYRKNLFIFGEGKLKGTPMSNAQRMYFESLIERLTKGGAQAFCFVFEHDVTDTSKRIYVDVCNVTEMFSSKEMTWRPPNKKMTLIECVKAAEDYCTEILKIKI